MKYRNRKITHPKHKRKTLPIPHRPSGAVRTVEGIFSGTSRRFGFVTPEGATPGDEDIFIPAGKTGDAIDGDRVQVRIRPTFDRRCEGEVTGVLEEGRRTLIGTLISARDLDFEKTGTRGKIRSGTYLLPDDGKVSGDFRVIESPDAEIGDKVEIALPARGKNLCRILRVFGKAGDFKANYEAILAGCGIETAFDPEAERQAETEAAKPISDVGENRRRFEREIILTIDGADAKDLDDAVSLRKLPDGGWLLGVHIADVSAFVPEKTPLDREAMRRGTSVYFIDRVVPMLPVALSNGACSLNAGEEKATLSAHISLSPEGEIRDVRIERGIIVSRVRGVYSEVNDLFQNGQESPFFPKYREVYPTLLKMRELYLILASRADGRGSLSLDSAEPVFSLDEDGFPTDITVRERGDGEKMIEQFMLTANEAVATKLRALGVPCVYRVHDDPIPEKVATFRKMAKNLGLDVSGIDPADPGRSDFRALLADAEEKGIAAPLSLALLRSMAKAKYEPFPKPHFGLRIETYCHFTSPIRRLSDLATHRVIEAVLLDGQPASRYAGYVARVAAAASEAELRAMDAERKIEDVYCALWLEKHIGEVFDARVSSVTGFGLFAELGNTCEGLIPIGDLPGVYLFDAENLTLSGGKITFRLGDPIRVKVEEVEPMAARVRFSLAGGSDRKQNKPNVGE